MIRSHDDNVWSDISVMTSCHDCHVTSVQSSWHVTSLSPVTEMSISSIQMSSPPPGPHASVAARERGELNWNHLKWSILHYRIWLTIKTTIHWTRVDKKWAPNIFICLRENNKMHILKRWARGWWHSWHLRWIWWLCSQLRDNEWPRTLWPRVSPCSSGHLSPWCHIVREDIFAYCEMLPHWTHETSNRCQCNDNNIQRKKKMDPAIVVTVIVFCDSDKFQGTSRTKEDGYCCLGWAWIVTETGIKYKETLNVSQWPRYWEEEGLWWLPGINELTLSCSDNIRLAPGGRRSLEQIQKYKRLT